jgi:hypothetical protein
MSRSGYTDDGDNLAMWRGMVASATRGRRGQRFFRDLVGALDEMPNKRLIAKELRREDEEVCAIGALGVARGVDLSKIDPECPDQVAPAFDIAECLAQEVVYMNDESFDCHWDKRTGKSIQYTPEERWQKMREWAAKQIRVTPEQAGAKELPDNGT